MLISIYFNPLPISSTTSKNILYGLVAASAEIAESSPPALQLLLVCII